MKKLVIYLMAEPETPELALAAVEGGADIVELGFPFSDPLADGPVVRRAAASQLAALVGSLLMHEQVEEEKLRRRPTGENGVETSRWRDAGRREALRRM